jgi:FtsP/CotA-like multicopper oxidase with cupredoxin domain
VGVLGGGGGGGVGGTTVIDPPPGLAFRDPAEAVKNAFGVYELEMKRTQVSLNQTTANLITYNGSYPGPTIRARAGEELRIRLKNSLSDTSTNLLGHVRNLTNLHTHGLHVSPEPPADSMAVVLGYGEQYDYVYDMSFETPGHINLYHPHIHGNASEQYWGGLMGALVVEDEPYGPLAAFETHVMVLKDITLSGGLPEAYTSTMEYMHGKEGNLVMVNGQVNPVLPIRPGQVQRWQIVNGCNARFFKLSLEGHALYLAGTDGGLLDRPYPVTSILLSPGERVDLLVKAGATKKNFRFLSMPYNRGGMSSLQQVTLLTLSVGGRAVSDSLPSLIDPGVMRLDFDTSGLPRKSLALSMMQGRGYINGQTYIDMNNACTITSGMPGTSQMPVYELWEVVNQSGMDHPFHQHVNAAQVLSISGGDPAYASLYTSIPAWKDTVIVPKMGSVTLLVPVLDWTGMAMFHCHIMEHEDIGMMGVWRIGDGMSM